MGNRGKLHPEIQKDWAKFRQYLNFLKKSKDEIAIYKVAFIEGFLSSGNLNAKELKEELINQSALFVPNILERKKAQNN